MESLSGCGNHAANNAQMEECSIQAAKKKARSPLVSSRNGDCIRYVLLPKGRKGRAECTYAWVLKEVGGEGKDSLGFFF